MIFVPDDLVPTNNDKAINNQLQYYTLTSSVFTKYVPGKI